MRRRSAGHRPTGQRRKLVWADYVAAATVIGNSPGTNFDLLTGYRTAGGSTQGVTIMRTHISINALVPSAGVGSNEGFSVGLIVDDNSATAVTLNTTKPNLDWMLYKTVYWASQGSATLAGTNYHFGTEIDLRAKRKAQELQQTYWLCLLSNTANNATTSFHVRTLLALP